MSDFLYIVHLETIIPLIFAGAVVGITLFNWLKLNRDHYFLLFLIQLIYGVVGMITRLLEGAEYPRFAGVIFLYFVFLVAAIIAQKISIITKIAPYFTHK